MTRLGANLGPAGCTFAVWAPFAQSVAVIGDFNGWDPTKGALKKDAATDIWSNDFPAAKAGQQYKYYIEGPRWNRGPFERPDPYGRQMLHSAGPSIIKNPGAFAWTAPDFVTPAFEDMVIYEVHVPTFVGKNDGQKYPGNFQSLLTKLDYLRGLGVNTLELLPVHEYAGDAYLGYAPAAFFPVESSYGSQVGLSYDQLQAFVDAAHAKGLAVIIDVVFNHFTDRTGADKWIWDYDGDTFYGKGGIYFSGAQTEWGPAPNWERSQVVAYVEDACRFYLQELRCDGLRWDATKAIKDKPGGWDAMRNILWNLRQTKGFEKKILIAEQLPYEKAVVEAGNFHTAWWVEFHHSLERELGGVRTKGGSAEDGINGGEYSAIYKRVVYSSGHDEARNGSSYLPSQFSLEGRNDWDARAKCRLISSLQFCIPGIPMIWQGEEFLQDRYFNDEYNFATNWKYQMDALGLQMQAMYKDILRVRKDHTALRYGDLIWAHCRDANNVLAFLRHDKVNGQTILVVVNCGAVDWVNNHSYGISTGGTQGQWRQLFCSQDPQYGGWEGSGNAYYEPWTQSDGKVYLNVPKYSVVVMKHL